MKSTGLFGKNSGRVGGVVYSNYRGQQIVRSYQPQVKNPNSKGQIAQRAKFKLVSQLGAVFAKELKNSYLSEDSRLTSRNAWVRKMLKKTVYSGNEATLPIEEVVLTNATGGIIYAEVDSSGLEISVLLSQWDKDRVKARALTIAYSNGGDIVPLYVQQMQAEVDEAGNQIYFKTAINAVPAGYSNVRVIAYVYQQDGGAKITYDDYEVNNDEATLEDLVSTVGLSNLRFSGSVNLQVQQGV